MVNDKNLSEEDIWSLTGLHCVAREHKNYPLCNLIQDEIARRPANQRTIASKLNYYQPLDLSQTLFREVA